MLTFITENRVLSSSHLSLTPLLLSKGLFESFLSGNQHLRTPDCALPRNDWSLWAFPTGRPGPVIFGWATVDTSLDLDKS